MKTTIIALCVALSVFMCNSTYASAAACSIEPREVHDFSGHEWENEGFVTHGGPHTYLYGYDSKHNPIYRSDCHLSYDYLYCHNKCINCGIKQESSRHSHKVSTNHSVKHD